MEEEYKLLQDKEISIRAALKIRREHGAHMETISAIWQECEVSKPNKLVPVPTNLLFRGSKKTTNQQQV